VSYKEKTLTVVAATPAPVVNMSATSSYYPSTITMTVASKYNPNNITYNNLQYRYSWDNGSTWTLFTAYPSDFNLAISKDFSLPASNTFLLEIKDTVHNKTGQVSKAYTVTSPPLVHNSISMYQDAEMGFPPGLTSSFYIAENTGTYTFEFNNTTESINIGFWIKDEQFSSPHAELNQSSVKWYINGNLVYEGSLILSKYQTGDLFSVNYLTNKTVRIVISDTYGVKSDKTFTVKGHFGTPLKKGSVSKPGDTKFINGRMFKE